MINEERSFSDCLTMLVDIYISLDLNSLQCIMGWIVAILFNIILIIMRYLYMDRYSTIEYILMILSIINVIYLWWWSYKIYNFFFYEKDITPNIINIILVGIYLSYYDQ